LISNHLPLRPRLPLQYLEGDDQSLHQQSISAGTLVYVEFEGDRLLSIGIVRGVDASDPDDEARLFIGLLDREQQSENDVFSEVRSPQSPLL
jgi:hypothetical protein